MTQAEANEKTDILAYRTLGGIGVCVELSDEADALLRIRELIQEWREGKAEIEKAVEVRAGSSRMALGPADQAGRETSGQPGLPTVDPAARPEYSGTMIEDLIEIAGADRREDG